MARPRLIPRAILWVWLALVSTVPLAIAQETSPEPAPPPADALPNVDAESLRRLQATLADPAALESLRQSIAALLAVKEGAAGEVAQRPTLAENLVDAAAGAAQQTGSLLTRAGELARDLPAFGQWLQAVVQNDGLRARAMQVLAYLALLLGVGLVAELITGRLLRGPGLAMDLGRADEIAVRAVLVPLRTLIDLVPVLAFWAAAYAVYALASPPFPEVRIIGLSIVNAYAATRCILILIGRLLAPHAPRLRLLPLDTPTAVDLHAWVARFTNTAIIGYFALATARLLGLFPAAHATLLRILGLVLTLMAIAFILRHRTAVARWIGGAGGIFGTGAVSGTGRRLVAAVWHVLAIVYVITVFVVFAYEVRDGGDYLLRATLGTLGILALALILLAVAHRVLTRMMRVDAGQEHQRPGLRHRMRGYFGLALRVLRAAIGIAALLGIFWVWGFDVPAWLVSPPALRAGHVLLTASISAVLAVFLWESISAWIERYLERTGREETAKAKTARARTVLPLLRKAMFVTLAIIVGLIVLSEVGLDIAPLIASAGVLGIAVGFGAQKLVQDVITGLFILIEDSISVGDVVNVGGLGGLVEDITIRTIKLRDLAGTVHTVPFSAVTSLSNLTKDFSYYVANLTVSYREDTDQVVAVANEVVEEMRGEPDFSRVILGPLEVLGVDKFAESGVVVAVRIKTLPIQQWSVGRQFNRRLKKRFDELGIEIAIPHVRLYFGAAKEGETPPAHLAIERLGRAGAPEGTAVAPAPGLPATGS